VAGIPGGWRIYVRCGRGPNDLGLKRVARCNVYYELELGTMLWTRGKDMPLGLLSGRMQCPRCGSRRVTVHFSPPMLGLSKPRPLDAESERIAAKAHRKFIIGST